MVFGMRANADDGPEPWTPEEAGDEQQDTIEDAEDGPEPWAPEEEPPKKQRWFCGLREEVARAEELQQRLEATAAEAERVLAEVAKKQAAAAAGPREGFEEPGVEVAENQAAATVEQVPVRRKGHGKRRRRPRTKRPRASKDADEAQGTAEAPGASADEGLAEEIGKAQVVEEEAANQQACDEQQPEQPGAGKVAAPAEEEDGPAMQPWFCGLLGEVARAEKLQQRLEATAAEAERVLAEVAKKQAVEEEAANQKSCDEQQPEQPGAGGEAAPAEEQPDTGGARGAVARKRQRRTSRLSARAARAEAAADERARAEKRQKMRDDALWAMGVGAFGEGKEALRGGGAAFAQAEFGEEALRAAAFTQAEWEDFGLGAAAPRAEVEAFLGQLRRSGAPTEHEAR